MDSATDAPSPLTGEGWVRVMGRSLALLPLTPDPSPARGEGRIGARPQSAFLLYIIRGGARRFRLL
jgi:hypothetical protein